MCMSLRRQPGFCRNKAVFLHASRNGCAVLLRDGTVSVRNIRNIYCVKHINSYIDKKPLPKGRAFCMAAKRAGLLPGCRSLVRAAEGFFFHSKIKIINIIHLNRDTAFNDALDQLELIG
ncbi:hypothetical protein D3C76_265870 [compost metagenome]